LPPEIMYEAITMRLVNTPCSILESLINALRSTAILNKQQIFN